MIYFILQMREIMLACKIRVMLYYRYKANNINKEMKEWKS
jgi:hypothetical protein